MNKKKVIDSKYNAPLQRQGTVLQVPYDVHKCHLHEQFCAHKSIWACDGSGTWNHTGLQARTFYNNQKYCLQ